MQNPASNPKEPIMFDYEALKLAWWALMGVLLMGFALTDGFDIGAVILMPFVGKTDSERRVVFNTIGPHWEGNQVWLVTIGGALFAAWPEVYATAFSGFYWAMMLVLFALFGRPVGFDYRSKIADPRWRASWDWALFVGSLVPALVFGVAFGNLFLGLPFYFDDTMRVIYTGSFFGLLNPFALLVGVISVTMMITHGGTWLMLRSDGSVRQRARHYLQISALIYLLGFIIAGFWVSYGLQGYRVESAINGNAAVDILQKTVSQSNAGWLMNYIAYPWTKAAPAVGVAGGLLVLLMARLNYAGMAFFGSSLAIIGTILTAGFALFPFVMPSSTHLSSSLTLWDATSSHMTLSVMLVVAMIFVPLILLYTLWGYWKMWGTVTTQNIEDNTHSSY
jgi:cytochrome d ubiquinol oxidase subunit II